MIDITYTVNIGINIITDTCMCVCVCVCVCVLQTRRGEDDRIWGGRVAKQGRGGGSGGD